MKKEVIEWFEQKELSAFIYPLENFDELIKLSTFELVGALSDWTTEISQIRMQKDPVILMEAISVMHGYFVQILHAAANGSSDLIKEGFLQVGDQKKVERESLDPVSNDSVKVRVSLGFVKNLGNFESFRGEAGAEQYCAVGGEDSMLGRLTEMCNSHLEKVKEQYMPERPAASEDLPLEVVGEITSEPAAIEPEVQGEIKAEPEKAPEPEPEDPTVLIDLKAGLNKYLKLASKDGEVCYDLAVKILKERSKELTVSRVRELIEQVESGNYQFFKGEDDGEIEDRLEGEIRG
jgi:hypothetical protein